MLSGPYDSNRIHATDNSPPVCGEPASAPVGVKIFDAAPRTCRLMSISCQDNTNSDALRVCQLVALSIAGVRVAYLLCLETRLYASDAVQEIILYI